MALQNMADNAEVVAEAWRVLRPGGFFQFSIPHPCFFTRMYRVELGHDGHAVSVHVGGYFDPPWGEEVDWKFVSPGVFETRSRTHPRRDDTARRFLRALSRGLRLPAYGRTPSRKSEPDGRTFATFRERRYSRTLGDWLGLLLETGFTLERVVEPCPSDDAVRKHPELTLGRHQAFALIVRSRKPS
jgi:SAM-dependent methyltransferase